MRRRDETLYVADGAEVLSDAFDRKRRVEKPAQKMEKLKAYVEENGRIPLKGDPRLGFDAYGFWDHCCRGDKISSRVHMSRVNRQQSHFIFANGD